MDRDTVLPKVNKIPGPNAIRWADFHKRFTSKSTYEYEFVMDRLAPAIGPFATDVDGNVIMDFGLHVATAALGYNNPKLVALKKSFPPVDPDRYAGTDFVAGYGPDPEESPFPTPSHMQKKLVDITKKYDFKRSFLVNSGAEAIENAMKFCYDEKRNYGYGFCFDGAFHGRTLGALSLNRSKTVHRKWYPKIGNIVTLPFCACVGDCKCGWQVPTQKGMMSHIRKLLDKDVGIIDKNECTYLVMEPVQGEGGYRFANPEFMKEINEVCKDNGIRIISDEIQAGMGRTGKWWGIENYDVQPDIITAAKALRVGAVISKEEVSPKEDVRISGTWAAGNAMATAVGYKTIEIIEKENLLENSTNQGKYFLKEMKSMQENTDKMDNSRGIGLMMATDFATKDVRNEFTKQCLENGLLFLGCGHKSVRILPPLDVTKRELDIALGIMENVVKKI
ncbi:MAG: aminotransferase class III-fold pyridoxal phosphate-dependent enzyme [Nanoarchaeota archaeon]|nr:aminotransferase class III-fold pyridoxal phosphate-dependent enzyme [Nanoarchaeota archaeon]